MKKKLFWLPVLCVCLVLCACGTTGVISEDMWFKQMTNIQYYPQNYLGLTIEYDCFTYAISDVDGKEYVCGVRQCSSAVGCQCGKDRIIGFILNCDQALPEPKNQSNDDVDKTWIHVVGKLKSQYATTLTVYAYAEDGVTVTGTEEVPMLELDVESFSLLDKEIYQNLAYYVSK